MQFTPVRACLYLDRTILRRGSASAQRWSGDSCQRRRILRDEKIGRGRAGVQSGRQVQQRRYAYVRRPADAERVDQLRDTPGSPLPPARQTSGSGTSHWRFSRRSRTPAIALGLAHGDAQARRAFRQALVSRSSGAGGSSNHSTFRSCKKRAKVRRRPDECAVRVG